MSGTDGRDERVRDKHRGEDKKKKLTMHSWRHSHLLHPFSRMFQVAGRDDGATQIKKEKKKKQEGIAKGEETRQRKREDEEEDFV